MLELCLGTSGVQEPASPQVPPLSPGVAATASVGLTTESWDSSLFRCWKGCPCVGVVGRDTRPPPSWVRGRVS